MKNLILLAILLILATSCDRNKVFEAYKQIEPDGWFKDSIAVFPVNLEDAAQSYDLFINVRNKGNYENSNLWLFVDIKSPDGQVLTDTIEYTLADNSGRWTGSGIGDLFDNQFPYKQNVYFPVAGEYQFTIKQGMRISKLQGIQDIGFRIEKRK